MGSHRITSLRAFFILTVSSLVGLGCVAHATPETTADGSKQLKPALPEVPEVLPEGVRRIRELYLAENSLAAFKGALLEKEKEGVRVVQYGASHTRGGSFARELRNLLAEGTTSPGWFGPRYPYNWDVYVDSFGEWQHEKWTNSKHTGPFGPAGVAFITTEAGASMEIELKGKVIPEKGIEFSVLYEPRSGHLPFAIQSGEEVLAQVTTYDDIPRDQAYIEKKVTLPPGAQIVRITTGPSEDNPGATLRLYGMKLHYPGSRLAWDALGINGSRGRQLFERGDAAIEQYLQSESPDLLLLWYGTNSVVNEELDLEVYAREFGELLERLRSASPHASCLVLGITDLARNENTCFMTPRERKVMSRKRLSSRQRKYLRRNRESRVCNPDALVRKRGRRERFPVPEARTRKQWNAYVERCKHRTPDHLPTFAAVQKRVALEHGCAFYDVFQFMGGRESIVEWACNASPRLASIDLIHLSGEGYRLLARGVFSTLMEALHGIQPAP